MALTPSDEKKITIFCKNQERREEFAVSTSHSIGQLRPLIAARYRAHVSHVCLVYAGRQLQDTENVIEALVDTESEQIGCIHVVIRRNAIASNSPPKSQSAPCTVIAEDAASASTIPEMHSADNIVTNPATEDPPQALRQGAAWQNINRRPIEPRRAVRPMQCGVADNAKIREFFRKRVIDARKYDARPESGADFGVRRPKQFKEDDELKQAPSRTLTKGGIVERSQNFLNEEPLPNPWAPRDATNNFITHLKVRRALQDAFNDPVKQEHILYGTSVLQDPSVRDYLRRHMPDMMTSLEVLESNMAISTATYSQERETTATQSDGASCSHCSISSAPGADEVGYERQMNQLIVLGYEDRAANLRALVMAEGDLTEALLILNRNKE